ILDIKAVWKIFRRPLLRIASASFGKWKIIGGLPFCCLIFQVCYSGIHKKVTQRVGWVENPTSTQAV
ncbi:MAG: hypothetical protein KAZ00_01815, partial [Neisseria sp.]|nr:hypothetical protein [Neisseria sp.]